MLKIGVLVVTYNRLDKLKKALHAYSIQSYKPKTVIVVDNNSKADTNEYLKEWLSVDEGFEKKVYTIGNIMVLTPGLCLMRNTKPMGRGYLDVFLCEFYKRMVGEKKCNLKMLDAIGSKKKEIAGFRSEQNFKNIAYGLMLDDFLDSTGKPKQVFHGLFSWEPGIPREAYLKAATEFLNFCEPFVDKRADRIIEKLDSILKNSQ